MIRTIKWSLCDQTHRQTEWLNCQLVWSQVYDMPSFLKINFGFTMMLVWSQVCDMPSFLKMNFGFTMMLITALEQFLKVMTIELSLIRRQTFYLKHTHTHAHVHCMTANKYTTNYSRSRLWSHPWLALPPLPLPLPPCQSQFIQCNFRQHLYCAEYTGISLKCMPKAAALCDMYHPALPLRLLVNSV